MTPLKSHPEKTQRFQTIENFLPYFIQKMLIYIILDAEILL